MPKPTSCERETAVKLLCTRWQNNTEPVYRTSIKRSLPIGSSPRMLVYVCVMNKLSKVGFTVAKPPMGFPLKHRDMILRCHSVRRNSTVSSACQCYCQLYALRPPHLYHLSHHHIQVPAAASARFQAVGYIPC